MCQGYAPGPLGLNANGAPVAAVKLVPAWDKLNAQKRDALYARLSWCISAPRSPCNGTNIIVENGVVWVWAGWYSTEGFIGDPGSLSQPAVLTAHCSGGGAGGDAGAAAR